MSVHKKKCMIVWKLSYKLVFCVYRFWKVGKMIYVTEGSVTPISGYVISEQDKELFKLLLAEAKANLNAHSLTKKESVSVWVVF